MATFSRIKAPIACAIILAFFVAGAVMDFPDYGKAIYKSAEAVDYDEYKDQTGFPAGDGYEEMTSVEELFGSIISKTFILILPTEIPLFLISALKSYVPL